VLDIVFSFTRNLTPRVTTARGTRSLVLELAALRRLADLTSGGRASTNNAAVNSASNAVLHLDVELGEGVHLVGRGLLDVTHGAVVNDVLHGEAHDSLVLGGLASAAIASDLDANAATVVAVTAVVPTLDSHSANQPVSLPF